MSEQWLRKSGRTTQRRQNSTNGGPRFWVTFDDGTRLPTATDANVAHRIENSDYDGDVEIWLVRGEITDIRAVGE